MKRILIFAFLICSYCAINAQAPTDTASLRELVRTRMVPNTQIKAVELKQILDGILNCYTPGSDIYHRDPLYTYDSAGKTIVAIRQAWIDSIAALGGGGITLPQLTDSLNARKRDFGIEDNLGLQNRSMDMQGHSLAINSGTGGSQYFQQNSYLSLYAEDTLNSNNWSIIESQAEPGNVHAVTLQSANATRE